MTNRALASVEIFESYVGKGAPSNARSERRGYGLTKKQARKNAGHWANQAPFSRERKITVSDVADVSKHGFQAGDWEKIAWTVCGIPTDTDFESASKRQKECAYLIGKGRYATAIIKALSE